MKKNIQLCILQDCMNKSEMIKLVKDPFNPSALCTYFLCKTFADQTLKQVSWLISILVAMSCFGALNGGIFASSR